MLENVKSAGGLSGLDIAVVVTGANHLIPVWIGAWRMSGNVLPVEFYDDGTWTEETRAACRAAGRLVDASGTYRSAAATGMSSRHAGWLCKPLVMASVKHDIAVWCDHDLEVRGRIEPMVEAFVASGAWFASPKYGSFSDIYAGRRVAQHGIIVYKPRSEQMRGWAEYVASCSQPNDEINFVDHFGGFDEADRQVLDLYRPEWYDTFDVGRYRGGSPRSPGMLEASGAIVVHWPSPGLKRHFVHSVRRRADGGAKADVGQLPVDAVFVLGTGSKHADHELRFAIRSLRKNCTFVRRVYVVGAKPTWWADDPKGNHVHVPADDPYRHSKDANIIHKLLVACGVEGLSETFLFCSDDQFVTKPSEMADFAPRYLRVYDGEEAPFRSTEWHSRLLETLKRYGKGAKYFQPHIWAPMTRAGLQSMSESYDWRTGKACTVMTMYYNHVGEAGVPNFDHTFCSGPAIPSTRHVAFTDTAFDKAEFRSALAGMFPDPVPCEKAGGKRTTEEIIATLPYTVKDHPDLLRAVAAANSNPDRSVRLGMYSEVIREYKSRKAGHAPADLSALAKAPCKSCGDKARAARLARAAEAGAVASAPPVPRPASSAHMACRDCARKHVAKGRVLVAEYLADASYKLELALGLGELACAEDHLQLVKPAMAKAVRDWRKKAEAGGYRLQELDRIIMELADA